MITTIFSSSILPCSLSLLFIIIMIFVVTQQESFAFSQSFVRQVISDTPNDWFFLKSNRSSVTTADNRTLFFNNATDPSLCKTKPNNDYPLPDLSEVSYLSDGKTLNSTFWLSGPFVEPPLNRTVSSSFFVPHAKVHQENFAIDVLPSKNKTLNETVNTHVENLKSNITNFNLTESKPYTISGNQAHEVLYTGIYRSGDGYFGNSTIENMDILTIKNNKLYILSYTAELSNYSNTLPLIKNILNSFTIDSHPKHMAISNFSPYDHTFSSSNITLQYPSNWIRYQVSNSTVVFFSPIPGPYLLRKDYTISIDTTSVYDSPLDYASRIVWDINNETWSKTVEEASLKSPNNRIIDLRSYPNFFKIGENYVVLPLNLSILNYPDQYQIIFNIEEEYIKDGYLCTLIDESNQVSSPPPPFFIIPSSSSLDLRAGETKSIEIKIQSHTNIPSNASFWTDQIEGLSVKINPTTTNIFPAGLSKVGLTVTNNANPFCYLIDTICKMFLSVGNYNQNAIPEPRAHTLNIFTNITNPTTVALTTFNSTTLINNSRSEVIFKNGNMTINVKPFDIVEQSVDFLTKFSIPITAAVTILAALIGAGKLGVFKPRPPR